MKCQKKKRNWTETTGSNWPNSCSNTPGENSQEPSQQDEIPPGKRRFTCLNCNRPFISTIGKFNHIRRYPECRNANQQETFENKRNRCSRTFEAPVNVREHQKFVCADLRKTPPTQEKAKTRENTEENKTKEAEPGNLNHTYGRQRQPNESGEMKKEHLDMNKRRRHGNALNAKENTQKLTHAEHQHTQQNTRGWMGRKENSESNKFHKIAPAKTPTR